MNKRTSILVQPQELGRNILNEIQIGSLSANYDESAAITSISVTSTQIDLKAGDQINIAGQSLEINADASAGVRVLSIVSITLTSPILIGNEIRINEENLFEQYQRKTEGTIAGFDIDADGITKGGVEITGWLDSDTMTGATANNVPTAESVKAYVDASSGGTSNYKFATSSGTGLTSATDGIANAVVVPFDTSSVDSASTTISLNGSGGIAGISGSEYSFSLDENTESGVYEIRWNVAVNTSVALNRYLGGVTLETGLAVAATPMTWAEVFPSRAWIYNRGTSGNRYGSAANSILYNLSVESSKRVFRVVFWKEDGQAAGKLITEINGCSVTIKQL